MFLRLWMTFLAIMTLSANANNVEEARLKQINTVLPEIAQRYQANHQQLKHLLTNANDDLELTQSTAQQGTLLWQRAVEDVQSGYPDDRALYWSRLAMRDILSTNDAGIKLVDWQHEVLLNAVEKASRGMSDIHFEDDTQLRILVTGFDPFFLDKDITQSNPSGLVALSLDGYRFLVEGKQAQIETVMIPVRFADFDDGMIESLLTPFYRDDKADMVVTVSMGREDFDLERFVARNRSADAPDNRNQYTGATKSQPKSPMFQGKSLTGPEFIEFSLPAEVMTATTGRWKVNDNHNVTTKEHGKLSPQAIGELTHLTSVEGSGGGYLSNEISYRSLRLQVLLNRGIPTGHIHTPRVKGYDQETELAIVEQTLKLIKSAASRL